mgnify:CR=1 FL=1
MIKSLFSHYQMPFRMVFVLYGFLVVWASLKQGGGPQPIEHFDKLMHFTFYGLFTVIAAGCTQQRKMFIGLSLLIIGYGALMEILQSYVPSRHMSLADIAANALGVITAMILLLRFFRDNNSQITT